MNEFNVAEKPAVLIIDDDLDLLMLLERILTKEGYLVETAANLAEAKEILLYYTPDIVLLDININGEDGRQLCWQLKKEQRSTPIKVLIMSGYDYSLGRAVLFGADDLMPKPLNLEFLLHKIRDFVTEVNERNSNS